MIGDDSMCTTVAIMCCGLRPRGCDWSQSSLSQKALGPWTLAWTFPDLHNQEGPVLQSTCVSQSSTSTTLAETHTVSRGVAQPARLARSDDRRFLGAIRLNHLSPPDVGLKGGE